MALFPLPAFRYAILLGDSASLLRAAIGDPLTAVGGGFTDCTGIGVTAEILEYIEGGQNGFIHKLPTRAKHSDIVLKRGMLFTTDLWDWIRRFTEGTYQRKDGLIVLLTQRGIPAQGWMFHRALPLSWTGPALSASTNGVATEQLTIAHEGLELIGLGGIPG
jgi:phage tail-like protein